jgi:hypothetical protein
MNSEPDRADEGRTEAIPISKPRHLMRKVHLKFQQESHSGKMPKPKLKP